MIQQRKDSRPGFIPAGRRTIPVIVIVMAIIPFGSDVSASRSRRSVAAPSGVVRPWYSIRSSAPMGITMSMADPTGVADSRPAIQSAIDTVSEGGGGVVRFPSGTYLLNSYRPSTHPWKFYNLLIPSNVSLDADPGTVILQGPGGRAPLPPGAKYVENDVVAIGTERYQTVTFQSAELNGGYSALKATNANDAAVALSNPGLSSKFAAGDFVAIYAGTTGDVIQTEISQLTSVDASTGELGLSFPLARAFSTPYIANVTGLMTTHVGLSNLTIQGAVPLAVTEVFDFRASGCRFVYDGAAGGANIVTGMVANTVRRFYVENSSFEPVGTNYAGLELPQRNSQDVAFQNVTFKVKSAGFGEYAAHWSLINNHFWLFPDETVTVGLATGGLDVEVAANDIHGTITSGNGSGALIGDYHGPREDSSQFGQIRFRGNTVECRADGNNCMRLVTRDPTVTDNRITATGSAYGIKLEGLPGQTATILNNRIAVGSSSALMLNSAAVDASVVIGNTLTGYGIYAIYVTSPGQPQSGGHLFSRNIVRGFQNAIFLDVALHPGTIVQ